MTRSAVIAVAFVSLLTSCPNEQFRFTECRSLEVARAQNDRPPPWPPEEDNSPAPEGPRLDAAEIEFVGGASDCGGYAAVVRLIGSDADVDGVVLARSLDVYPPSLELTDSILERDGDVGFVLDGVSFQAEVPICFAQIAEPRQGMFVHVRDELGRGSNAVCADVFALFGVDVPSGN